MIVNDIYSMEFNSHMLVGVGAVKSMRMRAEHAFRPTRVDLGHHHGHRKFELVKLVVGDRTLTAADPLTDLGTIPAGSEVEIMVRNIARMPERARPMLIGTLA
jgi:hypothetical protein